MFSRTLRNFASHSTFTLPPIHFRHTPKAASREVKKDVPVITSPVSHKEREKCKVNERKDTKDTENPNSSPKFVTQSSRKNINLCESQEKERHKFSKPASGSCDVNRVTNSKFSQHTKRNNVNKFRVKTSQSAEDNLSSLGFNVAGEIIFGIFPVLLALQAKRRKFYHVFYKSTSGALNDRLKQILNLAEMQGITKSELKPYEFRKVFQGDQVHQGVFCDASPLPLETYQDAHLEQLLEGHLEIIGDRCLKDADMDKRTYKLWLYLDHIHDPMNLGAVLRSAYFMGVNRILTSKAHSCGISSTVSKASAGVAEIFPVYHVEEPLKLLSTLTEAGWEVVSSAGGGSSSATSVTNFHPRSNILLIVGNEGKGITPDLEKMCRTVLTIQPGRLLHPDMNCLNVSVATAVLLHSLCSKLTVNQY